MADNSNKKDNQVPSLPDCDVTFRVMPMPPDTNQYGDVFGGWIMSQVDLAGASVAARRARCRCTTVAVTNFVFKEPVWVGDVVSFYGRILPFSLHRRVLATLRLIALLLQFLQKDFTKIIIRL